MSSTERSQVRAVSRALDLLRLMNRRGQWELHALHRATRLPKPTVYRLLRTLRLAGYVQSEPGSGMYRLTARVAELSAGYTERSLLIDVGAPIALAVTRRIRWPLALGTLEENAIVVRYSTMPASPLAVQSTTLGHRLGLLESAMGLAYLAFCPLAERGILLELLRAAAPRHAVLDEGWIEAQLGLTRRRGYGLRLPRKGGNSATIAVPVLGRDEVLGVLSMTTFGRSMTRTTIARHVPVLHDTARDIGRGVLESLRGSKGGRGLPAPTPCSP